MAVRRGSRLSDIINIKQRKKRHHEKKRHKNGFIWRRWAPDGDLLHQRAPLPHLTRQQSLTNFEAEETPSRALQDMSSSAEQICSESPDCPQIKLQEAQQASSQSLSPTPPSTIVDLDTTSTKSDNSFRTASSDPQLNLLPPKITDTYNSLATAPVKVLHGNKNGSVTSKELF